MNNPKHKEDTAKKTKVSLPLKVLLFNDDWHSFDEVIIQLIKALHCSIADAQKYAFEAHVNGSTVIFYGELSNCLKVTSILDEIALNTEIVSEE